ncbi:hypothetical protein AB1207_24245 [Kineococcus endophyticus]|uniref:Protein involved in plasmid replication-relaxation n=1 Tax=Kineococcus endophyticus TaxID=1181883 RepID=A0ABV3PES0_9ACTN
MRKLFVRREDGVPPLAGLYASGGRSGIVALKLYLTIVWRCSTAPYETSAPARGWASLLGLEDPAGRGARRVAAALKTLAAHQLVQVTSRGGQSPVVALLDESGDGSDYTLPSTAYARAPTGRGGDEVRARSRYFLLPGRLWTEGHMQSLAGPGLVMLLILLAEQGGQGVPVWFSTESFPARYRISHKTRAAGTQQLIAQGLLLLERQSLAARPYASDLDARRYRNVYHLQGAARTRAEQTP